VPELQHQITINAPAKHVHAAIAADAGLRSWWTADATVDQRIGGNAVFGFRQRRTVFRMTMVELAPNRITWACQGEPADWTGTILTWTLTPSESGNVVCFTHSGWKEANEMFAICNTSWGALMHRLKAYCEGNNPGPLWAE
jgi:uncharacterized protein YndB with AHSA1/START domain